MISSSEEFLFGDATRIEDLGGGISRQILGYNHELMVVKVWFESGSEGYLHKHRHSQVTYIVSGEFDVNIGGVIKRMAGGDCYFIPPNIEHGAICTKAGILIDTFSPKRDDFLGSNE
jgi:quercetin dioxygenase-like cupin family protein